MAATGIAAGVAPAGPAAAGMAVTGTTVAGTAAAGTAVVPGPTARAAAPVSAGPGTPARGAATPPDDADDAPAREGSGAAAWPVSPPGGGVRADLRRALRERRRVRMVTLLTVTLVLLGALPLYFGIRSATRDPVFTALDGLAVPEWAAAGIEDRSSGSRWCFSECLFRERTARSGRATEETAQVYTAALTEAGWRPWVVAGCPPEQPGGGTFTCWQRDEFTLDLWVRAPTCEEDPAAGAAEPGEVGTEPPAGSAACAGSTVSIKVRNAISDERGRPEGTPDPNLVGETPDPVIPDTLLETPTPTPS
jgi:integrin beta 3